MTRTHKRAGVICEYNNQVLLVIQRETTKWGIPKGHFDRDELQLLENMKLIDVSKICAVREFKEETGVTIQVSDLHRSLSVGTTKLFFTRNIHNIASEIHYEGNSLEIEKVDFVPISQMMKMGDDETNLVLKAVIKFYKRRSKKSYKKRSSLKQSKAV